MADPPKDAKTGESAEYEIVRNEPLPDLPPDKSDLEPPVFEPEEKREEVRTWLAKTLLGMLGGVLLLLFILAFWTQAPFKDVAAIVLSPVIGLVGAVTGFYYGARTNEGKTK
jgi:hypothetical protein